MKVFLALLTAVSLVALTAGADPKKTPITAETYVDVQTSCNKACLAGGANIKGIEVFCACGCAQTVANTYAVVSKYSLKYEEELLPHTAEIMPGQDTINICKAKAGIK